MGHYFLVELIQGWKFRILGFMLDMIKSLELGGFWICKRLSFYFLDPYRIFFVLMCRLLQNRCCVSWHTIIYFFGEYTCTFALHMVHGILVVDTIVYDMQV